MSAGMTCCMAKLTVSSRFSFRCKARFFAGLFFDVFFSFFFAGKKDLKQLQPA